MASYEDRDDGNMNTDDRQPRAEPPDITRDEAEAARKVVLSLLLAKKNFSLYPEGHVSIVNSVSQLHKLLEAYIREYGDLRFDIEKDQLLSQGEAIYSAPTEEGALPFIFFRDGIRWVEFVAGIDPQELMDFLKIVIKYSVLSDEPEGDIVTSFWETPLPHIRYEVADFFWGAEQDADLMPTPDLEARDRPVPGETASVDWSPLPDPAIDQASIVLSPQEKGMIREMVELEEKGDPTGYLDALLDSLLQDKEQDNFEVILEVLEEEFKGALPRKDFDVALKILLGLQEVRKRCSADIPWAVPLLEDFALTLSSSQSLGPLKDVWTDIEPGRLDKIRRILELLQPEAISTLAAMLLQNQSPRQRQILLEVIASLASRDMTPLESLLTNPDERLMEKLVHVFVTIQGERTSKILARLVRHKSPHVRQEAVKELLQRGTAQTKEIFNLINDRDESVRAMVLKLMGQSRSHAAEAFLRDYLENRKYTNTDSEHIIACFAALGRCGSSRSLAFLRETLIGKGWMPVFGNSVHREGAAVALSRMDTKESRQVLEEALRSLNPRLRNIVRKAR
jgi:hypothetical protein